jgi:hypothetical protein
MSLLPPSHIQHNSACLFPLAPSLHTSQPPLIMYGIVFSLNSIPIGPISPLWCCRYVLHTLLVRRGWRWRFWAERRWFKVWEGSGAWGLMEGDTIKYTCYSISLWLSFTTTLPLIRMAFPLHVLDTSKISPLVETPRSFLQGEYPKVLQTSYATAPSLHIYSYFITTMDTTFWPRIWPGFFIPWTWCQHPLSLSRLLLLRFTFLLHFFIFSLLFFPSLYLLPPPLSTLLTIVFSSLYFLVPLCRSPPFSLHTFNPFYLISHTLSPTHLDSLLLSGKRSSPFYSHSQPFPPLLQLLLYTFFLHTGPPLYMTCHQ